MMGKDENACCAYHRLRGHHTQKFHQLKKKIKISIQRGRLLSYVKDVGDHPGKRSPPREDTHSRNPLQKKGDSTYEACKAHLTLHTFNTIAEGFTGGGETNSARKR